MFQLGLTPGGSDDLKRSSGRLQGRFSGALRRDSTRSGKLSEK